MTGPADSAAAAFGGAVPRRRDARPAQGDSGQVAQRQLAWQREMERAQMTGWFKSTAVARENPAASPELATDKRPHREAKGDEHNKRGASTQANRAEAARASLTERPQSSDANALGKAPVAGAGSFALRAVTSALAQRRVATELEPAAASDVRVDARLSYRWRSPMPVDPLPETVVSTDSKVDAAAESRSEPAAPLAPLRLHEESTPQGQAVWFAMRDDDEALTALLPRLVADLQRGLRERGQRLYQVVCNGRLVWLDDAPASLAGPVSRSGDHNSRSVSDSTYFKEA